MNKVEAKNFPFYQFRYLSACPGIVHFVSSGVKNIGFSDEVNPEMIRQNRLALAEAVGFDPVCMVTGHQIHSVNVAVVTQNEAGKGALDKESRLPDTDALVTDQEEVCLMVLSADCVPVLLFDPVKRVVAAIHAGWRGTAAGIVVETIKVMEGRFGCQTADMLAGIGPSIGKWCFEVSTEVADVFRNLFPQASEIVLPGQEPGKFQVDLWEANRQELIDAGVKNGNIEIAGMCTVCHPDHFFSFRRDKQDAGRFGAGIMLRRTL